VKFDARAWVSLAKAAGVKYITITSRHHDGFAMFATRATPYNIVDWTPFHRDPLKELADECRRQGIKLFFYYSQLDWHHPDYWPRARRGTMRAGPRAATGIVISTSWMPSSPSCSRTTGTRRHLVRRDVGQAPTHCRLAAGPDVCADPSSPATGVDRAEPSSSATAWRRCADVRAGFAGREHRRFQYEDHRRLAARDRRSR